MKVLSEELDFTAAAGFSAGSLNAAAWACGRIGAALESWLMPHPMTLRVRLWPPSLFSEEPLKERLLGLLGPLSKKLVVISSDPAAQTPVYGVFGPGKEAGLRDHLLASCAIPFVFPAVNVEGRTLVDGGVPMARPISMDGLLEGEIIGVCPVRPDEPRGWSLDSRARGTMLKLLKQAAPAKVLYPSRRLDFTMLTFKAALLREAAEQGERDARAFLNKL